MKNILLHVCCAPCLIYPYQYLTEAGFEVINYFYNPNIHPYVEYEKRLESLKDYTKKNNLKIMIEQGYELEDFFLKIKDKTLEPERCNLCWQLRLEKTAQKAKELSIDTFTTTLLVSPYQDQAVIKELGESIAKKEGLNFYYHDFSLMFKQAHDEAKKLGLYLQKYCGCLYSERARYLKQYRKKANKI
jgi:hypothetical protein